MLAAPALPATTKPLPCGSRLGKRTDRLPFPTAQTRSQDGKETSPPNTRRRSRGPLAAWENKRWCHRGQRQPLRRTFIHKAAHTQWHTRKSEATQSRTFWGHKQITRSTKSVSRAGKAAAQRQQRREEGGTGQTHLHPMPLASQGPQEPTNQQSPFPPHQGHAGGETEAGTAAKPSPCWVQPPPAPHPQQLPAGPGPSQAGRFAFCCKSWMEMSRGQSPW